MISPICETDGPERPTLLPPRRPTIKGITVKTRAGITDEITSARLRRISANSLAIMARRALMTPLLLDFHPAGACKYPPANAVPRRHSGYPRRLRPVYGSGPDYVFQDPQSERTADWYRCPPFRQTEAPRRFEQSSDPESASAPQLAARTGDDAVRL